MLKPIKTAKLKTVGLGIGFARRIMEHAAAVGSYDLSESELVFAMGAARERDDLMSVLELLDKVLDLIKRGFDRRANFLAIRIINNVGIMLRRGGFSREYSGTLRIYDKISAVVEGKTEILNYSECREEIHKQLSLLRAGQTKQTPGGSRGGTLSFSCTRALNAFNTVSERGTLTLNTLNSGMLQITARNPELLKMIKLDKTFMELSLKNIENIRRRTERTTSVQRFFGALTSEQIKLLERFVADENLFSELREKSGAVSDLKYLLENSSEKSLSEFFGTLRQRIEERSVPMAERSYFDSVEKMKEFFVGARRSEIERLIKELDKDRLYRSEARTLTNALRLYETETEKHRIANERITELYRIAEAALRRKISAENFSEERFITALGASRELKRIFADYAWENYRSEETVKRFAEYMKNTVSASGYRSSVVEQAVLRAESHVSESAAPGVRGVNGDPEIFAVGGAHGDGAVSDNGGLTVRSVSESAAPGVRGVNGEPEISAVGGAHGNGAVSDNGGLTVRSVPEIAAPSVRGVNGDPEIFAVGGAYSNGAVSDNGGLTVRSVSESAAPGVHSVNGEPEIFAVGGAHGNGAVSDNGGLTVRGVSESAAPGVRGVSGEPKISAVGGARGNGAVFDNGGLTVRSVSESAAPGVHGVNGDPEIFAVGGAHNNGAVSDNGGLTVRSVSESAAPGVRGVNGEPEFSAGGGLTAGGESADSSGTAAYSAASADRITKERFVDFLINSGEINLKFSESVKNSFLNASSDVAAAFAEYLVSTVREDSFAYFSERVRSLAEKAENILYCEGSDIEEKSAETFSLIYSAWNECAPQLSEMYASFTQSRTGHDEIMRLYSYLPKNNYTAVSELLEAAAQGDAYFIELSNDFFKQSAMIWNKAGDLLDRAGKNSEYTFYDALSGMSENALSLLLPLVGICGGSDSIFAGGSASTAAETASVTVTGNNDGAHANSTSADPAKYDALVERTAAFVVSTAFAEYLSSTVRGSSTAHYNERIRTLADRIKDILHSERTDIREKTAEALELIYSEWNDNSVQLSELYAGFEERCADRGEILRLYSRLPQNDIAGISNILGFATRGETNFFSFNSSFPERLKKLFGQMSSVSGIASENSGNEYDLRSEQKENRLVLEHMIKETAADLRVTKNLYQRLISAEKASGLIAVLPDAPSRCERRVYNIPKSGSRLVNKSIVTDKKFYSALTAFYGEAEDNITDRMTITDILPETVYPALTTTREYFFTWESGSVTRFNRASANKIHIRTSGFFERHNAAALALSERISEKFSAASQHSDYNTAAELFYTDEYFESSRANTQVNYAIPAAASGGSDKVSEKLGNIRGAVESINAEIAGIKQREEEISREFVTKSEQKVFERELKSSIERDIYLAGKRHGIY